MRRELKERCLFIVSINSIHREVERVSNWCDAGGNEGQILERERSLR